MSKYSLSIIISLIFFLLNCQENPKENSFEKGDLLFETFSHTWYASFCEEDTASCAKVVASYPIVSGNPQGTGKTINDSILGFVKSAIGNFQIVPTDHDEPITKLVVDFFNEYEYFVRDFPDFEMPWVIEVKGRVLYNSMNIVSIEMEEYSFTGGAHPNSGITLLCFDLVSGKVLNLEDIIKDIEPLKVIAREKFRIARKMKKEESFENAGFLFGDSFKLPDNFAITEEGLYLFYNAYEVGAYVLGTTSFTIPYKEIKDLMKIK